MGTVNELSSTIDLIPLLSRAEALFHRFERKVETIDKKYNFPAPPLRQRKPIQSNSSTEPQPQSPSQLTSTSRPAAPQSSVRSPGASRAKTTNNSSSPTSGSATASGVQNPNAGGPSSSGDAASDETAVVQVISPLLRNLLSKETPHLERSERRATRG